MLTSTTQSAITWQKRLFRLRNSVQCLFLSILSFAIGCMGDNDSSETITRITLTAPVQGFDDGICRVRERGRTYELTGDQLQECRDVLRKLYNSEVICVDRDSMEREYYTLEYCDARSGDVLISLHVHYTSFSDTDSSLRVDIDGIGTTYVPWAIGVQFHYLVADYKDGRRRESHRKASN